ncbi:AraC family transcriptional regulator, partial [Pseudomonas citronellolis]|uniref:helix-turn-helix domain-containing protein n=1 Tax=Pseudomonas citronellolis TaxID=53408 RepID=UPI00248F2B0C
RDSASCRTVPSPACGGGLGRGCGVRVGRGAASSALALAGNLQEALDLLLQHRARFCPLLAPRLLLEERYACLYWVDACGLGGTRRFLVESSMTAVTALCRWLAGEHLPWRYLFAHAQPGYLEQYQAHLGLQLQFDSHVDAMLIPREYLVKPWPRAAATAGQAARRDAQRERQALGLREGFLEHLYRLLQREAHDPLSLEQLAARLGMSPATCKRKLQKHHTHFQALHDEVRKHVALYLYWSRGYGNDEVAQYLRFTDTTNFRRSFKRWTGLVPSAIRGLQPDGFS